MYDNVTHITSQCRKYIKMGVTAAVVS